MLRASWILIGLAAVTVLTLLTSYVILRQPKFGADIEGVRLERLRRSPHYVDGEFRNLVATRILAEGQSSLAIIVSDALKSTSNLRPTQPVPTTRTDLEARDASRALGPKDVAIKLHYCGVCHSDIHTVHEDWGKIQFPQIVGHELAGEVVAVGSSVSKFKVGARAGVGTMVDSCRHCSECEAGHENYCLNGNTQAYGSKDRDGSITQGGYSTFVVVDEDFVINIPAAIELADAGPLMCAGITVYSPLRRWGVSSGKKVAIVGMGGLGHIAVKLAKAMGAEVTVFTTSPDKEKDAKRFGATNVAINKDDADFSQYKHTFDFALDTVPYKHDVSRFIPLLKRDATFCRVGVGKVTDSIETGQMSLVMFRNAIAGSNTGGIRETQDMVDFCALNNIKPEITMISPKEIDDAWKKVVDKKVRYRFVMDLRSETII